jgi:hypothetical protein
MRRFANVLTIFLVSATIGSMTLWASLVIYYSIPLGPFLRGIAASLFTLGTLLIFLFSPVRRRNALPLFLVVFLLIVVWWVTIPASNDRDWQDDVSVLPYATVQNNLVTVHNIRNLTYRTETDFDAHYYNRTFNLNTLDSVDLICVYWMGNSIAHIMMSFSFNDREFVTFSIETRKEKGEDYSAIKGFFKQYELIYIVGDERDLIRVRTDYRNPQEDVYLYRTRVDRKRAQKLFIEYIRQINMMKDKPVWYNTLTTNCTTNIVRHIRTFSNNIRYNWKILLSGYAPLYAYEMGILDTRVPFKDLEKLSYINPKAHLIGNDPEFSRKIREGLPLTK